MNNFTFSPVLGSDSHAGFMPLLYGILLALVLTCFLKETGPAVRKFQT